jgi:hypothetical protein
VYEDDPRFAREQAPSPGPEGQEPDRPQTPSNHRYGLNTSASSEYETELYDFLGRPNEPGCSPSDARLPRWPCPLSPHALATLAVQASPNDEPCSWAEATNSIDGEQWQALAEDEMCSLQKAKVFPAPSQIVTTED